MSIAKTIWDVGKSIFGLRADLQRARRDRRGRLAKYFGELAELIESVSASLRMNQYPHGKCAQLETLARLMSKTVKGLVEPEEARRLQDKLLQVWEIERLFGELQGLSKTKAEKHLVTLDEAAGYFRATAAHLRVI